MRKSEQMTDGAFFGMSTREHSVSPGTEYLGFRIAVVTITEVSVSITVRGLETCANRSGARSERVGAARVPYGRQGAAA
ncbi:hypothetical protein Aple_003260 [Acrocarpospora pleiomorpha]|uniref:Uncharacterized protein n=1 Tax=Acrocarpospora pleiomorpha TaxID=90975 RepID=A0A5M3XD28_9ACTN|nr:hypothetical protein Aple_003260 [Acrocarpospora pleiomorpha]